jgi:hypothetical protein
MAEETAKSALIEKLAFALLPLLFSCGRGLRDKS